MSKETRTALVLGTSQDYPCDWNDYSPSWQFIKVPTIDAADALLAANAGIRVGLWSCADGLDEHFEKFPVLRAKHRVVQWIALLPPARLEDQRIATHVAYHFFDFLTLPVEEKRILSCIGHAHGMSELIERAIVQQHGWPGNIRELINRVRRAMVMCDGQWITPRDLDLEKVGSDAITLVHLEAAREKAERQALDHAIKLCSQNYSAAARILGVSRPTLYRLLDKHRLTEEQRIT